MLKNVDLKKINPYENAVSILTAIYFTVLCAVVFSGYLILELGPISFVIVALLFPASLLTAVLACHLKESWYQHIRLIRDIGDKIKK